MLFIVAPTGVVIILISLKLLQEEQNILINYLPYRKVVILTDKNNQKNMQRKIANENYTHVFISPKIALSKKFKENVLNNPSFMACLSLLPIDEIHLVEQWGKNFWLFYAEIKKICKKISCQVSLLGISATLVPKLITKVLDKLGFFPDYKLMRTSLDRPEIMQIHQFIEYAKSSCLDLQFILPKNAKEVRDI